MEFALRLPRIAVAGVPITVEYVAVREGTEVHAGDRLLDLRVGSLPASFHSEVNGAVRDIRSFAGDELMQDRVVMFVESPAPPPIRVAPPPRETVAVDGIHITFHLPKGLLHTRVPLLARILAAAGDTVQSGQALLEFAVGPVRFVWPAPVGGTVERLLLAPGDDLPEGTAVIRLKGSAGEVPPPPPPPPPPPIPELALPELSMAEFRRRAQTLRGRTSELAALVREAGLPNSAVSLDEQAEKLATCRFTVAVVGEFKRGKSTFLNALAGREFLPNDVVPCTAFACRFQYAERLHLVLLRKDGVEVPSTADSFAAIAAELDRLTRDTDAGISEAIIRLPLELCRDGVDLLDTPGLNDSEAMNQVTLAVLPNVDAAVLLLIPESPVADTEKRFLQDHLLARDISRVLFVLNAVDRIPAAGRDRLVKYMEGQLARIVAPRRAEPVALLPVSSKKELLRPGSADTGFAELHRELDRKLFRERGRLLLMQAIERVRAAAAEAIAVLELRAAQQAVSKESFHGFLQELERQLGGTRLHSLSLRRALLDAQAAAEAAAAARAGHLHLSLLALRESLPAGVSIELLRKPAGDIKAELTAAFAQNAGRLYQQALNALLEEVRAIYQPQAVAVRQFVDNARGAFITQVAGQYRSATAERSALPPARLEPPDAMRFGGTMGLRVELSLGAMSWLYLADSIKSVMSASDLASSIEARALEKLRADFGREIEAQVRTRANEPALTAGLAEFARAPFHDLLRRLDQDLKILLDDSFARLASLRDAPQAQPGPGPRQLRERIAAAGAECEEILAQRA